MSGRLLRCGERGVLVELGSLNAVLGLDATIGSLVDRGEAPWRDIDDRVAAAETLLLTVGSRAALPRLMDALRPLLAARAYRGGQFEASAARSAHTVTLGVHYDGPDLPDVAALTGLTEAEVVAAHTGTPWLVGFAGFAPGFAYLVNGDRRLVVPRRTSPRTLVPAGSVGLAGAFSGVYPRPSPGGWQLIGHTDEALWDTDREPPALLQPGWFVRFVDLGA